MSVRLRVALAVANSSMCPHCGREAPIVYRGVVPYCTACGALRAPLATPSLNLAGKPSQVGGTVASVAGWLVLLVGLSIALGLGLLLGAVFSTAVALGVALPFATISAGIGLLLLRGGRSLRRSGVDVERATRDQALLQLAAHRGPITAARAAHLLNLTVAQADAMLTELAKRDPERIALDVDDHGAVWYRIARPFGEPPGLRVDAGDKADDAGDRGDAARAELEAEEAAAREANGEATAARPVRR